MDIVGLFLIFGLSLCVPQIRSQETCHQCGIGMHSFVPLIHGAWEAEEGDWPWHVAIFHKNGSGFPEYACGGTLIGEKHILTAAHCVMNHETGYPLQSARFELHFGQLNLSEIACHTQIRDVSEVHVHPQYSTHRSDVAVLVTRLPVDYTDFVIPICMDQRADKDLRNLEGKRGYITGWGTTQNGVLSDVLRTASMPVVSYLQCYNDDQVLFGNILNPKVFCAGDRNGTSPGTGDSGGGMYFNEEERWVLKGIVSFAKANEKKEVDPTKYAVFVNVQRYLTWIKEIVNEPKPEASKGPKRISEKECDRFKGLAEKRADGTCANNRLPHAVSIGGGHGVGVSCDGVLINEFYVLATCECINFVAEVEGTSIENLTLSVKTELYATYVEKITCHPNSELFYGDDLAVIKLRSSLTLSSNLIPACLASNSTENLYDTLLQTGVEYDTNGVKKYLESEEIQVINHKDCDEQRGQMCVINTNQSIAGYPNPGSPLQSVNSRTCMYTIVGLVSGIPGWFIIDNSDSPRIYTRISHYLDWIEEIVWNVKPSIVNDFSNAPRRWEGGITASSKSFRKIDESSSGWKSLK